VSDYEHILLREIAPACAVVDASGAVLHFSGPVGRYLEPQGAPSNNIVDLAREAVRFEVRTALRRAVEERRLAREDSSISEGGDPQLTEVVVRPLPSAAGPEADRYLVAFRDVRVVTSAAASGDDGESALVRQLRAELAATRQRLQATLDEAQSSSSEHRRASEKLRNVNEELQASQEELESLNEELQTLNGELAAKVEELDRANADLQNLFRSTDVAVVFLDTELAVKRFTPAATRLFRLIDGDVGRHVGDIVARFPGDGLVSEVEEVMRSMEVRERQVRVVETGRWYSLRILPYVTVGGWADGAVVTFGDITEAKLAEAASRASEVRLRQIVDSVPHLVWTAGADGTRDYFSQQWRDYTGLSAGPQLDEGWIEAYHPEDRGAMLDAWRESLRTGKPFQAQYRIRRHDGVYRWFRARANPLRDASGQVERWIGTSTDMDDVKRLEASLREGSRRKDEFMALLGHELRNPLAPLGNSLDILRRHGDDPAHTERALAVIDRQVTHLTRLVDDLLDVSRITRGKIPLRRERLDLSAQLDSIIEDHRTLFADAGLRLEVDAPRVPLWVDADAARLAQMIGNLLQNARKFTDRGGEVKVSVLTSADRRGVSVTIRDTGIGMDPSSIERMFDAFAQADETLAHSRGGLGLGLALVKALAELHGGSVRASSAGLGHGSEFVLQLPLASPPAVTPGDVPRTGSRRVLVVDDNADAAETLADLLRLEGHDVRVAVDGRAALDEARRFRPEIAFCDIGLPGDLDGYALARALRAEPGMERTPLVAMTGYALDEDQRRTKEAGFALHLTKPTRIEVVARAIGTLTGGAA
jgi:two-component system CheB/CheR fusion protein